MKTDNLCVNAIRILSMDEIVQVFEICNPPLVVTKTVTNKSLL